MNELPLCCFAPVSWYILYAEENFCLAHDEYFQKQTCRNRFDILTGNGVQTLTIPVESTGGEQKLLRDIRISSEYNAKKTFQAIRSAYGNSAMFDFIQQELEVLFLKEEKYLFDFNVKAHEWSCRWFPQITEGRLIESKIPEERLAEPKIHIVKEMEVERWKHRGTRPVELKRYPQVFADRFPYSRCYFQFGKDLIE